MTRIVRAGVMWLKCAIVRTGIDMVPWSGEYRSTVPEN
jgi:hypothetical protein